MNLPHGGKYFRSSEACRFAVFALALVAGVGRRASGVPPQPGDGVVPAAVEIHRPSPSEVTHIRDALGSFLEGADAETKALVHEYPDLIAVRPPRENPALEPALRPAYEKKREGNLERIGKGPIQLLLMGDSITDFWRNIGAPGVDNTPRAGARVGPRYFDPATTANFGISGDTIQGVLYRLKNGEGSGFQPKAIMLLIGTNNIATCSAAEIAEGIGAIVFELRKDFPSSKILLLGIFPRGTPDDPARQTIAGINRRIAALDDRKIVHYLDIRAKFLASDGTLPPDIMPDKLHPSEKGYVIWGEATKDILSELMR